MFNFHYLVSSQNPRNAPHSICPLQVSHAPVTLREQRRWHKISSYDSLEVDWFLEAWCWCRRRDPGYLPHSTPLLGLRQWHSHHRRRQRSLALVGFDDPFSRAVEGKPSSQHWDLPKFQDVSAKSYIIQVCQVELVLSWHLKFEALWESLLALLQARFPVVGYVVELCLVEVVPLWVAL